MSEFPVADQEEYYYVDPEDDGFIPDIMKRNLYVQYGVYSILAVLLVGFLYFMIIFLPSLTPDGIDIPDIRMIKEADYYLYPVSRDSNKHKKDPLDPNKVIPDFANMDYVSESNKLVKTHLKSLESYYDTGLNEKNRKKRLIMIGDVHGCLDQLKKLLHKFEYDGGENDQVLLLGDFMNKGPHSMEVLDFVVKNKFDCILGNHELAMMKRYTQLHNVKAPLFFNDGDESTNSTLSIRETYDLDELMKLAKKLTPNHIDFLSSCSPIRKIGPVPHFVNKKQNKHAEFPSNGIAVHAGLVWSTQLNKQDIEEVTTMRNLLPPDWKVPTEDRHAKQNGEKSIAWTKVWNQKQQEIFDTETSHLSGDEFTISTKIFYGHDAKRGLTIKEFSNGLDSGCVYGKQLTGTMIWAEFESDDEIVYKQMIIQVNC